MKRYLNYAVAFLMVTNALAFTGCGHKPNTNSESSDIVASDSSNASESALEGSKSALMDEISNKVSEPNFTKQSDEDQQKSIQEILNSYISSIIKTGTISYNKDTRTYNFEYIDGTNGMYSLSSVKYSINNQDNLVWQGQTPNLSTSNSPDEDNSNSNTDTSITTNNNNTSELDSSESYSNNTEQQTTSQGAYIIGVKLNYNNATGFIQGRFISSTGGAYAFDFTDRFTMVDLDLLEQLTNIIETRTCTYGIDSKTLENLKQLSESIDYTAELYQSTYDTQKDMVSEIIYTYNRKTGLLVECCASGVKESHLDDTDADAFAVALLDAIDTKVQRLNN